MTEDNKQLGVFWGKDNLYFVETASTNFLRAFSVPLTEEAKGSLEGGALSPVGMEIISIIQSTLRHQKVSRDVLNVSLPTKDIIFRSFVIPWMQSSEIGGVVDFEASKYVPFALEELSYSFYPMTINDGHTRKIRIVFVAIKKTILESYTSILEQAALNVNVVEPSTTSLIRGLISKGLISKDETVALIDKGDETGNITAIERGLPEFVREFQLRIPMADQGHIDNDALMTRLMNEIRISLNYFNRQEEHLKVKDIMLLTAKVEEGFVKRLEADLKLSVKAVAMEKIFEDSELGDVGFFKAYGAALFGFVVTSADLNFSGKKPKAVKVKSEPIKIKIHYRAVLKVSLICVPLIALTIFLSSFWVKSVERQSAELTQRASPLKDIVVKKVRNDNEALRGKLNHFKSIRLGSDVADFLVVIPTLLPEGVWIEQLDILYPDQMGAQQSDGTGTAGKEPVVIKPTLDIKGYAYSKDPSHQFVLVDEFLKQFKADKNISSFFSHIDFETVQSKQLEEYNVTFFHLKCK